MKLEEALKFFSPQTMRITDSAAGTSPDRISGAEAIAAIGVTSGRARFGLAALLGKTGVSKSDAQLAVQALARYAAELAPKSVRKTAGRRLSRCMLVLAQFAYADYARSAASSYRCPDCQGKGSRLQERESVKYPGLKNRDGEVIVQARTAVERVSVICKTCNGRGNISARCRCKGTGKVLDRKATKETGAPVFKECGRCGGKGFIATPSTAVYKAILAYIPDLHVRTWTRNWKPFYEALVAECWAEEQHAKSEFRRAIGDGKEI